MINSQTLDVAIMLFLFVMGIIMMWVADNSFKKIKTTCTKPFIRSGMTAVLVLSVIFITVPLTYSFCRLMVRCQSTSVVNDIKPSIYIGFIIALSLTLIVISALMLDYIGKDTGNVCGGGEVKSSVVILLVMSSILFVASVTFLILRYGHILSEII